MTPLRQGNSDSHMAGSQLLQLLHTDETEQKEPDIEILCGLWVLKGPSISSICDCYFLTRTAFPLVPSEFKHCSLCYTSSKRKLLKIPVNVIIKSTANWGKML